MLKGIHPSSAGLYSELRYSKPRASILDTNQRPDDMSPMPAVELSLRRKSCQRQADSFLVFVSHHVPSPPSHMRSSNHSSCATPSILLTVSRASSHPSTQPAYSASHTARARISASSTSSAPQSCHHRTYSKSIACTNPMDRLLGR